MRILKGRLRIAGLVAGLAASAAILPDDAIAQGSCSAAASQAAAESGGQVLSVTTAQQSGRTVCIVTVLVPGRDGSRPRRVTLTIPQ